MTDYAKVMIEKGGVSSLQESIDIGRQVMKKKLAVYLKKSEKFEQDEGMNTAAFIELFNRGELGDDKVWMEWDHTVDVVKLLKKKIDDIENLKYEY